jgi:tetratricopeptide (TPR) repeat protein
LSRKIRKSDEADMSELATFIKASMLLKRENIIPVDGPHPQWWLNIKKMMSIGAHVSEVPLDHRMPLLEKGSTLAAEAMQQLEEVEDQDARSVGLIYAHVALAVFRSCFYELFPDSDMTVICYLMAVSECAHKGITASDTLKTSLFVNCVVNAFRRTRTGSEHMSSEKIAKLSKLALGAIAPKNQKAPTPMELQRYCTVLLSVASASLFCRNFEAARENVKQLVAELPHTLAIDDVDMAHQIIDANIIYARCLTEEKKTEQAMDAIKKMIAWLGKKIAIIAPRKIVVSINRWRPELSSSVNGTLWATLTAYQMKLMEANPNIFSAEELAQLLLLLSAHLCHIAQYDKALEACTKAKAMVDKLNPRSVGANIGGMQIVIVRAWVLEGLAKKETNIKLKQQKLKEAWLCLTEALNYRGIGDESTQVAIMAKMAWLGQQIPNDPAVSSTLSSFLADDGIKEFIEDEKLIKWGKVLPSELLTPFWGLGF